MIMFHPVHQLAHNIVDLISLQQLVPFFRIITYWVLLVVNYRLYRTTTFHLIVLKETLGHNLSKSI